ncbi:MAG: DMT family transporter, partial [Prochlorothrix sp.]
TLALASMVAAVCALSLAAIFIRLSEQELGPFATVFNRFWIAFIVAAGGQSLLRLVQFLRQSLRQSFPQLFPPSPTLSSPSNSFDRPNSLPQAIYTRSDIILLIINGSLFWACIILWAISLLTTGVANSTILHNLTPIFTALGAWLLFNEQFDRRFLMGLALTVIGAIGLGLGDLELSSAGLQGDIAALLSAILSAANLMTIERLRHRYSTPTIITWSCAVGAILSLPLVLLWEDCLWPHSWSGWFAVIGLALVCQILGQGLQTFSLKSLSPSMVGVILLLDPVLAALVAWAIFAERLSVSIQGVTEECGFQALKIPDWYGLSCFRLRSEG